jgi:hypothetical protein
MILPLAVIFGANWSTGIIWRSFSYPSELMNNIQPLNERGVNLEAICSTEFDGQKRLR